MEVAAARDLMMWIFHLETLTMEQLQNLTVNGLPALHHLATLPCKPEDRLKLDQMIKLFKNAGCDLNQTTNNYSVRRRGRRKRVFLGFTPLLVAIEGHNVAFVECLLQNGARVDIYDQQGFFPLHWTVFVDNMNCFRMLIQAGALQMFTEEKISGQVRPILHTAVDEGETEMVTYLLENGLVDLNQEADYTNSFPPDVMDRKRFYQASMRFTPLAQAIRMSRQPIVEALLKHGAKVSGFNELHQCILEGDVEAACMLLDQYSPPDLANDKIDDKWALLCLDERAFLNERLIKKTIELIHAYVASGWDLNSVGKSTTLVEHIAELEVGPNFEFCLLHLACHFRSHELIKNLVEMGADVNSKTRGDAIIYPLQVSILKEDWPIVKYLMANGSDTCAVGGSKAVRFQDFWQSEPDSRDVDLKCHFTSIDLLLQLGKSEGMTALEQMLRKGVPPPEKIAFQRAVYGRNCEFVCKVVEQLCGVQKVKMEDLTWLPVPISERSAAYVPSFYWFFKNARNPYDNIGIRAHLADVVDVMGRFDYDFTLGMPRSNNGNIRRFREEPLILSVLKVEQPNYLSQIRNLPLLEALLKFDKVSIKPRTNPVNYVMREWVNRRFTETDIRRTSDAVCLLIRSGVDVSGVTVGNGFRYYRGYLPMMKLLCSTGATIQPHLFVPSVASDDKKDDLATATGIVNQEIEELKKWKENFDRKHKFTLKHSCLLKIRGELKTTGDLRKLYRESVELESVMEDVMFQFMNFD